MLAAEEAVEELHSNEEGTVGRPVEESKHLNHPVDHLSSVTWLQVVPVETVWIVRLGFVALGFLYWKRRFCSNGFRVVYGDPLLL